MASQSARIDSPDLIKEFRNQFVIFDSNCQRALDGVRSDIVRTVSWLKGEQLGYWKRELRKREELVLRAKEAYQRARMGVKSSCIEEKKALSKAQQRKEEAEQKLELVKKWIGTIESKSGPLLGPCVQLSVQLADLVPRGISRLDKMLDSLDAYFRASSGGSPSGGSVS